MRKLRHESGRTMLEMIGVLVVIGLLTVGSLTGYSYLIQRHRRQEVAREAAQLVMGIKASGAARKYGDGAVIPARDFVSGAGVKENPRVLKFADGENSYAVVNQLSNGAFVINLQLEPGTCETVLEALKTEDAILFKPLVGDIKNSHQMEEESKRWLVRTNDEALEGKKFKPAKEDHAKKEIDRKLGIDIIEYCNNGGYVSWAEGCDPGDAAYGNIVSTTCHGCEAGNLLDINGKCCPVSANNCGTKYCECPAGTMCNQETSECVECSTFGSQEKGNEQCKKIYDKFSKHVCRSATNSCVECLTSGDCSPTTGYSDSALYAGKDFHYCSDYKCVECNMDYNGKDADEARKEFPCPTQTKPLCNQGTCEPCPEDQVWDDNKKECVCTNGKIKTANGTCALCVDNKTNYGLDSGCEQDTTKPMCTDDAVSTSYATGGTMKEGTQCVECVTDKNCEHNTNEKVCDPNTHTCVKCINDKDGYEQDTGCDDPKKPMCNGAENGGAGTECTGCAEGEIWNNFEKKCAVCYDSATEANTDAGCGEGIWKDKPICDAGENTGNNKSGNGCAKCINDNSGDTPDTGCNDSKKPMCNGAENGGYGTECFGCPEGEIWNAKENKCVKCYDSASGSGQDANCDKDPAKKICDAGENTGNNKSGNGCNVCMDDNTGTDTDSGCGEGTWKDKPICLVAGHKNESSKLTGSSCVECFVNADCPSTKPFCDTQNGYVCSTCAEVSARRGHNPLRTHYVKNDTQDGCYVCIDDKTGTTTDSGCGGNGTFKGKPICDTGTNDGSGKGANSCKTGCTGCIDANGNCLKLGDYEDLEKDAAGKCKCKTLDKTFRFKNPDKVSIKSDYSQSFNYKYASKNSNFLKHRSVAENSPSLKKMYCAHEAEFHIIADDCVYETFLGKTGDCDACWQKCMDHKEDCVHHKANYMCNYNKTVTIPAGAGPYSSIWVDVSDIHKTACGINGSSWVKIK